MTGLVHLDIKKSYPAQSIKLKLEGLEQTKWVKKEKQAKTKLYKKHNAKRLIIEQDYELFQFNEKIVKPGQYSFPFTIILPPWLPSSFVFFGKDKSQMKVIYNFKGQLELAQGQRNIQMIQQSRRVVIIQPKFNIQHNKVFIVEQAVKSFFFINQGSSKAEVLFEKDSYQPDENANIICKIDNSRCDKDLNRIKVKLTRKITCLDQYKKQYAVTHELLTKEFQGIRAGAKEDKRLIINLKEIKCQDDKKYTERQKKKQKKHPIEPEDFQLAEQMLPSAKCQLIQCSYFLEVKFEHKGLFSNHMPPAVLNLNIYAPTIFQPQQLIAPPQNWNPFVYAPHEFQVPDLPQGQTYMDQINAPSFGEPISAKQNQNLSQSMLPSQFSSSQQIDQGYSQPVMYNPTKFSSPQAQKREFRNQALDYEYIDHPDDQNNQGIEHSHQNQFQNYRSQTATGIRHDKDEREESKEEQKPSSNPYLYLLNKIKSKKNPQE